MVSLKFARLIFNGKTFDDTQSFFTSSATPRRAIYSRRFWTMPTVTGPELFVQAARM